MVIAKKPSRSFDKKQDSRLTEAIINRGGGSPSREVDDNNTIKVTLRLTSKMLNMIDNYLEQGINKKTRTSWIREALEEKIEKEIIR